MFFMFSDADVINWCMLVDAFLPYMPTLDPPNRWDGTLIVGRYAASTLH